MTITRGAGRIEDVRIELPEHVYRHIPTGRLLVSATQIMRKCGIGFQGDAPQSATDRGKYVHEVSTLIDDYEDLNLEAVPDDWKGYVSAYLSFSKTVRPVFAATEHLVWHPGFWYAGTLDRVMVVDRERLVMDLKTGSSDDVDVQLAAYAYAWNYWYPESLVSIERGACLKLNKNGSYTLDAKVDLHAGYQGFLACLNLMSRFKH